MQTMGEGRESRRLEVHGIHNQNAVYWNLSTPALYEEAIKRREGRLAHLGPLVVRTGQHTGRAPNDKYVVREAESEAKVWWGKVNRPMEPQQFRALHRRMLAYLQGKDLFVQDCFAGADPEFRMPIRVITETAWHSLFARNMFIRASREELRSHEPRFVVLSAPGFHADPETDGTRSEVFVVLNFAERLVLVGGTQYAGEIKKSIFTVMNYLLPQHGVLSMHASANIGSEGDAAVFFGLSGTGRATLSADPARHADRRRRARLERSRRLQRRRRLLRQGDPVVAHRRARDPRDDAALRHDPRERRLRLRDWVSRPRRRRADGEHPRRLPDKPHLQREVRRPGGHPRNIIMLTADAFGVLPPVASLTPAQAMYHFLSGYTAKVAGTEKGVTEPQATFSACFGAPFMALSPSVYARLLGERIARHDVAVWLVNTGWSGGPYGVGQRM